MNIEPKYVTFEQAKWFKEKGFEEKCNSYYLYYYNNITKEIYDIDYTPKSYDFRNYSIPNNFNHKFYNQKTNGLEFCSAPEQWQIIEWLRIKHKLFIVVLPKLKDLGLFYGGFIYNEKDDTMKSYGSNYNSPQEAYSTAFDYIIKNKII